MGTSMASTTSVRLTLKFNFAQLIRNSGWSENYVLGYADLATANANLPNINQFILDRLQCLGIGPYLASATLTALTQPATPGAPPQRRNTLAIPVPSLPLPGEAYNKSFDPAKKDYLADFSPTVMYVALQTALSGTPVYRRNCWLAGLPDGADQTNSGTVTDGVVLPPFQRFLGDLANTQLTNGAKNSVSIGSIDRSLGNPVKQCTAWNIGANTYTVPNHGFVPGQPVLAEGMRTVLGGRCPKGRYLIAATPDVNTIALQASAPPTAAVKFGGFRAAVYVYNTIDNATAKGFTKRDKGRPSGLAVGRRSTPRIVRA
jgi:hypothetical protein